MRQFYENKCDCKSYDEDQRASLIKLDVPEYNSEPLALRLVRLVMYALVLGLLGYSLWRIHVIESALEASDRLANITRLISAQHRRTERSVDYGLDSNSLTGDFRPKKPRNKDEFDKLVNELYDRIQAMHNDTDRANFDRNIKAVFNAWFPVFDALLRHEMAIEESYIYRSRGIKQYDDVSDERPRPWRRSSEEDDDDLRNDRPKKKKKVKKGSSEESRERQRNARSAESSESSEEAEKNNVIFGKKFFYKLRQGSDESSRASDESNDSSAEKNKDNLYYHVVT